MMKRSLIDEGFSFPEKIRIGEDVVLWLRIAARYGTFGIDKALTVVRASKTSAADDFEKQRRGIDNILAEVMASPELLRH